LLTVGHIFRSDVPLILTPAPLFSSTCKLQPIDLPIIWRRWVWSQATQGERHHPPQTVGTNLTSCCQILSFILGANARLVSIQQGSIYPAGPRTFLWECVHTWGKREQVSP